MPRDRIPTRLNRMIGPQLRLWLPFTGVIGLRPPPLPPLAAPGRAPLAGPALAGPALAAAGLAAEPDFSTGASLGLPPGFVLDGRRVPPPPRCVLMLLGPRLSGGQGNRTRGTA